MLEKLLSVLPYNPSMIHQLAFYSRRMREEASIRRTGFVFIVLAFLIQFTAVMSPPQSSATASPNDLVFGGFTTRVEAVSACNNNTKHYADILDYYGITCADVSKATELYIKSTDLNKTLWSAGRIDYPKPGETKLTIPLTSGPDKSITIFWRYLWGWDTAGPSTYKALKVIPAATPKVTYWILFDCGNLVSHNFPTPYKKPIPKPTPTPTPTPKPTPTPTPAPCTGAINNEDTLVCVVEHKTAANTTQGLTDANNTTAQPGDIIVYTLYAHNTASVTVKNFLFQESLSDVLVYADVTDAHGGTLDPTTGLVTWPTQNLAPGQTATEQVTVMVKKDPSGQVPQTPPDPGDPGRFDLLMTNTYTNAINIAVPGGPTRVAATAATKLVNTGPGTSLFIAAAIMVAAGYFYSRSRLLATEASLVVHDSANGGL